MGSKDKDIIMAKENELDKLAQFGTYEGWVITTKDRNTKARLVVKWFEENT